MIMRLRAAVERAAQVQADRAQGRASTEELSLAFDALIDAARSATPPAEEVPEPPPEVVPRCRSCSCWSSPGGPAGTCDVGPDWPVKTTLAQMPGCPVWVRR